MKKKLINSNKLRKTLRQIYLENSKIQSPQTSSPLSNKSHSRDWEFAFAIFDASGKVLPLSLSLSAMKFRKLICTQERGSFRRRLSLSDFRADEFDLGVPRPRGDENFDSCGRVERGIWNRGGLYAKKWIRFNLVSIVL